MKTLLIPMTLAGLLFVSDAFLPNAVNTRPRGAPILYTIPVIDERGVVRQQFVVAGRDATNQFAPQFQQRQPSSLRRQLPPTRFPSRTFTTHSNSHTISYRSPSVIFSDTQLSSHSPQLSKSFFSQDHRTPTVVEQTPHTSIAVRDETTTTTRRPQTLRNPGNIGSLLPPRMPSILRQTNKSPSTGQGPTTSQSTNKPSVKEDPKYRLVPQASAQEHSQSTPQTPTSPSSFAQGHSQSSPQAPVSPPSFDQGQSQSIPQAPASSPSFGQGHSQSIPQAPASSPSFGQGHSQSSPQAPPNPSSFDQGHRQSRPQTPDSSTSFGQGRIPATKEEENTHSRLTPGGKPSFPDPQAHLRDHVCYSSPDYGTCRAAFPRYYFDPKTGTCNCFLYGGCREKGGGEGPNSFLTLEQCQRACHPPRKEEGPVCKEIFHDEHFVSFLDNTPPPPHAVKRVHEKTDKEFVELLSKP